MKLMGRKQSNLGEVRKDLADAIKRLFPDDRIEVPDVQESWFWEIYPRLNEELSRIKGAGILYERRPEGDLHEVWDSEDDTPPPATDDQLASYHLFFVGLTDEKLTFVAESEELDENEVLRPVEGTGWIGCIVGVSLLAPYAAAMLGSIEDYGDDGRTLPDIQPSIFELSGEPRDLDVHFREMYDDEGVNALHALRDRIVAILQSHGVAVLPEEELRKRAPWLTADEEVLVGRRFSDDDITVRDALFYRCL
jgi:hypothetical protein